MPKHQVRVEGWDQTTRKRTMIPLLDPFPEPTEADPTAMRRSLLDTEAEAAALVGELSIKNNRLYDHVEVPDAPAPQPQ